MTPAGGSGTYRGNIHKGHLLPQRVLQRPAGAAAGAVVDGDHQGAVVHHIPVPPQHASPGVPLLHQRFQVAPLQQGAPAEPVLLRPSLRLGQAGNGGFQAHVPLPPPQLDHRLGEIKVAAPGHAADEVPHSPVIGSLHRVVQPLFQRGAPGIPLVVSPGQFFRTVSGKAAGAWPSSHCAALPNFFFTIIEQKF